MLNPGAVRNLFMAMPTSRRLLVSGHKLAAVDRSDGDVFPEHDFWAKLQEVEAFVRDQPFVNALRSKGEHESILHWAKWNRA